MLTLNLCGVALAEQTHNKVTDIKWVKIEGGLEEWKNLPQPSLALSDPFIFNPKNTEIPDSFDMMQHEASCQQVLQSGVLAPLRAQEVSGLCEYGMDEAITGIQYDEALSFCHFLGGEIPSEAQWVYVASKVPLNWLEAHGVVGKINVEVTKELSSFKEDVVDTQMGPHGIQGLYGNVWEITRTPWENQNHQYIMKGGAFDVSHKPWLLHPFLRAAFVENDKHNQNIGFRCVR